MTSRTKRIGRPLKAPAKGKRISLGLKVTAEVKRHIDSAARASGRTQSQEAEHLIERALQYDQMLAAMHTTLAQIEQGNVEAAFRRLGYAPIQTPLGKVWTPPGYPIGQSGFTPQEEDR
jgi:predicted transcriptional regulator